MTVRDGLRMSFLLLFLLAAPVSAQGQCGVVQSIAFPVDTSVFRVAQDFAAPSPRHDGEFHTGEDWYGGRGTSLGQPVRAIAAGAVTYESPTAWGRDRGVVIIEHTFPDGSVFYSMYGHLAETDSVKFPAVYSCVGQGQVIGVIADVRPAPHVHLEIRVNNPDIPGPGYLPENPTLDGWRRPSKFILNWQTWLQPSYQWHLDLADETGPEAPPLELDDHSLLYLDTGRVGRLSPDGRVLWRINLDRPAVGLSAYQDSGLLTYADGTMQVVNRDGTLGDRWPTDVTLDSPPLALGDALAFHTPDNALVAFNADRHAVLWRLTDVPPIERGVFSGQALGLLTTTNELLTISPQGQLLDRARLRQPGALDAASDGSLLAYTWGGLWKIDAAGNWSLAVNSPPLLQGAPALKQAGGGRLYLFDGQALHAYDQAAGELWQVALPGIEGDVSLTDVGDFVLLTSSYGHIIAVRASDGAVCNSARIWGNTRSREWHSLGSDGVLRVGVGDQIIGLDWQKFLGACG